MGKRYDYEKAVYRVHNIPTVVLGAAILAFGWFGFNAGSALEANGQAAHAFAATITSAAASLLAWMICDMIAYKKPTLIGACTGLVAGLVGITPAAGFVPIWASLIIGFTSAQVCFLFISFAKKKLKFDDALDAFSCHGVGGIWGGLLTGIFAAENIGGVDGAVFGNWKQFWAQAEGIAITIAISVAGTLICFFLTRMIAGPIRAGAKDEMLGLDATEHGESAYPAFNGLE